MIDDDETAPFAANAENKQLDKEVKGHSVFVF